MTTQDHWQEEFDKRFDLDGYGESHAVQNLVKKFIQSVLEHEREEMKKKLEEEYDRGWTDGFRSPSRA